MEERRALPRTAVDWRVRFAPPGEELHTGFVGDLNAKGLSILSNDHAYPAGTEIEVHFGTFQDPEHQFQLRAVVRNSAGGRMGLLFQEGPVTDHERLLRMPRGKF